MPETGDCPDDPEPRGLVDDSLTEEKLKASAAHLETCLDCRRRLELLAGCLICGPYVTYHRRIVMLNYAAVLLAASVVLGAERQVEQDDLKAFRPFLGAWEVTDFEYKGERQHVYLRWHPEVTDHYRFALSRPELDGLLVALMTPKEVADLAAALEKGPLDEEEERYLMHAALVAEGKAKVEEIGN